MTSKVTNLRDEPDTPSNTLTYFVREAFRRIWVSKRTSFVAVAMITISLLIVGTFLLIAENLNHAAEAWQGKSRVTVYLTTEITPEQTRAINDLLGRNPEFARRRYVTKEEALARFKEYFSNLTTVVGQLDDNPFPPSFEIEVSPRVAQKRGFTAEMDALRAMPGVDQVQYDFEWITRLRKLVSVINLIGLVTGGVLAIAAAFMIANVIRLTMMLYREEIEIMRLVGATERIIRGPFLIEGFIQGTIGGLFSVGLLFAIFEGLRRSLAGSTSIVWGFLFTTFLPWQKVVALIAGGMVAGFLGSWLSVRERPS
jgi:cell division transport system permease protein